LRILLVEQPRQLLEAWPAVDQLGGSLHPDALQQRPIVGIGIHGDGHVRIGAQVLHLLPATLRAEVELVVCKHMAYLHLVRHAAITGRRDAADALPAEEVRNAFLDPHASCVCPGRHLVNCTPSDRACSWRQPCGTGRTGRGSVTLRVALVGGPMYDGLYRMLDGLDIEVAVHADHPTLNRAVAERLARGERIDVLSTHSKYAPSPAGWLRPLDDLLAPSLAALAPAAVERCRFRGRLWSVPRNIDVRVLWANRRLLGGRAVPDTWEVLRAADLSFGFPGRES